MKNKEKDVILINKMFNSNKKSYANERENIVHEIINLFKANNGKHYIYIVKDGHIDKKYDDRISDILLTRSVGSGSKIVEIIAWVKSPKQIIKNWDSERRKDIYDNQMKKYIEKMQYDINYKVAVNEIFENNFYKEKKENGEGILYATFEADIVVKPKVPIFLTYDRKNTKFPKTYLIERKNFNTSQKSFVPKKNKNDYETLKTMLEDENNWEEKDNFKKVDIKNIKKEDNFNFLKLVKLENFELAFSNMLQYYFLQNKNIFQKFVKKVLGIDINVKDKSFEINREEQHIDIVIRDDNKAIVIENKIKSDINGKEYDECGDVTKTQLDDYREYIEKDKNRKGSYFIVVPNYNKGKFLSNNNGYKIITYKEIYDFYKDKKEYFKDDKYFEDFLKALKKHTKEVDSETYDIMLDRLSKRIKEIKDNEDEESIS